MGGNWLAKYAKGVNSGGCHRCLPLDRLSPNIIYAKRHGMISCGGLVLVAASARQSTLRPLGRPVSVICQVPTAWLLSIVARQVAVVEAAWLASQTTRQRSLIRGGLGGRQDCVSRGCSLQASSWRRYGVVTRRTGPDVNTPHMQSLLALGLRCRVSGCLGRAACRAARAGNPPLQGGCH